MRQYSRKAQDKIGTVMHEWKQGDLKSSSGKKVKSRDQAIAIGISEARERGEKVPAKKSAAKKSTAKKSASAKTKSAAPKKSAAKKSAAKKSTARKSTARKKSS